MTPPVGPPAVTPLLTVVSSFENRVKGTAWKRHTVSNDFFGAESVHQSDMDGDGLIDFVVGWEQTGVATMHLNPGTESVTAEWPSVEIGLAEGVETSVPVDLDGDGRLDVVSSLESGVIRVHWAPAPGLAIDDPKNWTDQDLYIQESERWGPLEAFQVDGLNGPDIVFGALGEAGDFDVPIGWLEAPANPRVDPWTFRSLGEAAFVTTIIGRDMDGDGDLDVVWTDRLFSADERGAWWFQNPGPGPAQTQPWNKIPIGSLERMPMTMDLADIDGDGLEDAIVPDREFTLSWHRRFDSTGLFWASFEIAWPSDMARPKAVRVGDIDLDGRPDLVATAVDAVETGLLVGVAWLRQPADAMQADWTPYNIGGPEGEKFDRIVLLDLDGDGDLDVVTTEERNNSNVIPGLGVVWYENPVIELDGDVDRDGVTGVSDLGMLLSMWGATGTSLSSDLDNSGSVGVIDLGILLAGWGREDADAAP